MRKCRYCGSSAELITSEDMIISKYVVGYKVICQNFSCSNSTEWFATEQQAISAWQDANKNIVSNCIAK